MRLFIKLPRFTFILGLKIFSGTIISIFSLVGQAEAIVKGTENSVLTKYSVMVLDDHGHVCSAAVLNKKVILTAAHCVADATDWRIHWRSDDGTPILIKPNKVLVHPGYEPNAISKRKRSVDLALISLSNPLPDQFLAIPLSPVSELSTGEIVTVAGFGFSEEKNIKTTGKLRSVDLAVVAPFGISRSILWLADAASKEL